MNAEWQPIETAPKGERTMLLLYRPTAYEWGKVAPGMYNPDQYAKKPRPYWEMWLKIGGTRESRDWVPTHWMPLPEAPTK